MHAFASGAWAIMTASHAAASASAATAAQAAVSVASASAAVAAHAAGTSSQISDSAPAGGGHHVPWAMLEHCPVSHRVWSPWWHQFSGSVTSAEQASAPPPHTQCPVACFVQASATAPVFHT